MSDRSKQNILALDPALKCGFAFHHRERGLVDYGTWDLSVSGSEHGGNRFDRLFEKIFEVAKQYGGIDRIAWEDSTHMPINKKTGRIPLVFHSKVSGIIELAASKLKAVMDKYKPDDVKAMANVRRHAKKPEMIQAARVKLGIDVSDSDAADALWILELAKQGVSAKEKERAVRKVTKKQRDRMLFK